MGTGRIEILLLRLKGYLVWMLEERVQEQFSGKNGD